MNQLILLLLLVFGGGFISEARSESKIDHLRKELNGELSDSSKMLLQSQLAWELRKILPQEADSLVKLLLSKPLTIKSQNPLAIGLAYKVAGYRKIISGEEAEGLELYTQALAILQPSEHWEAAASVYLLQGNLMIKKGELGKAVEYFYEGIRCADACGCEEVRWMIYARVARVRISQKEYETAEQLYLKTIAEQREFGDSVRLARTYYNFGTLWAVRKTLGSAEVYFRKAEKIFRKNKIKRELATTLGALGNLAMERNDLEKALDLYNESYSIIQIISDSAGIAYANYQIGNYLFKQKKYDKAENYINNGLLIAKRKNIIEMLSLAYRKMSEIKEETNKLSDALNYYRKHIAILQEVFTADKEKAIKEAEEKYKNEKLQQQNIQQTVLAARDKALRNSIILALILGLLIAFGLIWYYYQKRKTAILMATHKERIHEQQLLQMKQTAELRALNASQDGQEQERKRIAEALHNSMGSLLSAIQMHFQTLSETINFQKDDTQILFDKSLQLIKEAAITNRTIAHEMMPPVLMKFGLGAALGVLAEKIKGPNINVATSVYGLNQRLPEKLELSLYRIIDELINNIVKHAKASEVNIQMTAHEDGLNILVEDNGLGFNYQPNGMGYGIGLSSIMTRVDHFNGRFEVDSSEGNGTTIIIDIPDDSYR